MRKNEKKKKKKSGFSTYFEGFRGIGSVISGEL